MSTLDERVSDMHKKLEMIEAYQMVSEWLNNMLPSNKSLMKSISNADVLLSISQELSIFAKTKAEQLALNHDMQILMFHADEVLILKELVGTLKSKKGQ